MKRFALVVIMLAVSIACLALSVAHSTMESGREFYVRVFARQMLEAGVVDVEQFNSLYAKPNGGYGIDPLPTSNFSSTDAEKFLTPIPWKTGRWFLNAFMLLSGVMVLLSTIEAIAVTKAMMREKNI
jgi:hypothetical protein